MATTFTREIGYRGYAKLGGTSKTVGGARILATGGDVNLSADPIMASGVWGAGSYNAAENVIYAPSYLKMEGSINFELASGSIFTELQEFAFTKRGDTAGKLVSIIPNGTGGYSGKAWCSSMSFDASEGSIITGSFNFTSGEVEEGWAADGANMTNQNTADTGLGSPGFTGVFPYWGTSVGIAPVGEALVDQGDIISWNTSYSSEVVLLSLCSGREIAPVGPDYIMVGSMTADGSFTLFGLSDMLNFTTFQGARECGIKMNSSQLDGGATETHNITFGKILFTQGSTGIQTGNTYIQADFNFNALGDGTKPPMNLV